MTEPLSKLEAADFINRSFKTLPRAYGDALVEAARKDARIVCLSGDLSPPTETDLFRDTFPDRFLNAGIAEANMIGVAAGLATQGKVAFASSFAMFATGKAFEQIRQSVCVPEHDVQ